MPLRFTPATDVYLMGVCHRRASFRRVSLKAYISCRRASLVGVHLLNVYLFYESSLLAGHGWRESLYRHPGCFKASDCGRLGRQAAGHPWSALRVLPKRLPNGVGAAEAKAAALHPNWDQSSLSKL